MTDISSVLWFQQRSQWRKTPLFFMTFIQRFACPFSFICLRGFCWSTSPILLGLSEAPLKWCTALITDIICSSAVENYQKNKSFRSSSMQSLIEIKQGWTLRHLAIRFPESFWHENTLFFDQLVVLVLSSWMIGCLSSATHSERQYSVLGTQIG